MKNIYILILLAISGVLHAQSEKVEIYNPKADAAKDLNEAITKAKNENKHVLVQVGGNWCPWCIKLHKFIGDNYKLDSIISADYEFVRINYSKENKNPETLERLEFPQRFGFPVIVVLDGNGKRLHTQDTGYLEEDRGYSNKKIERFLLSWNTDALNPENYKKK